MQKIQIKEFGPIVEAEVAVDKTLLLIGEQASGKSTTAKLLYFFHLLPDILWLIASEESQPKRIISLFEEQVTKRFTEYFGLGTLPADFKIKYDYAIDETRSIQLSVNKGQVHTRVSDSFRSQIASERFIKLITDFKRYSRSSNLQDALYQEQARREVDEFISGLLGNRQRLFYPAGRGVAVNYPDSVKLTFFGNLASDYRTRKRGEQTIDLALMTEFIQQSERLKDKFLNHDFSSLTKEKIDINNSISASICSMAIEKIAKILRGKYRQDAAGEKIYFSDNKYVFLRDASSGQQEVVRLVQDIFLTLLNQEKAFRVIEEPEAHLWPMAQKYLIELMAMMLNQTDSQLVITTHSPYTLSVFNNLLYATHVVAADPAAAPAIAETIPEICWLNPQTFNAYMLKDGYCHSIVNKELGLIGQNFLDEISEELGDEFDKLYGLHAKVYA